MIVPRGLVSVSDLLFSITFNSRDGLKTVDVGAEQEAEQRWRLCDLREVEALCYQLDVPAFPLMAARSTGLPPADPVKHTLSLWCLLPDHGS